MDTYDEPPPKRLKIKDDVSPHLSVERSASSGFYSDTWSPSVDVRPRFAPRPTSLNTVPLGKSYLKPISLDQVKVPELCYPASQFDGWEPPFPVLPEKEALQAVLELWELEDSEEKAAEPEFLLSQFSIYVRPGYFDSLELVPLHHLQCKPRREELLLDGLLCYGSFRAYLKGLQFHVLSVGGYGKENHSVSDVWIQSRLGKPKSVWYKLGDPSPEYRIYHTPFLWVAGLTKHFSDYLVEFPAATLHDFRADFRQWLDEQHRSAQAYHDWVGEYGVDQVDFRSPVVTYYDFLWKETSDIDSSLSKCRIWKEFDPKLKELRAIPTQKLGSKATAVTPLVYACFKGFYFGEVLSPYQWLNPTVIAKRRSRLKNMGFPTQDLPNTITPLLVTNRQESIVAGDVVALFRDVNSVWKDKQDLWFAYVQNVIIDRKKGNHVLEVIWTYSPDQTTCKNMHYPYKNELFMSNHCNCGEKAITLSNVQFKVPVAWQPEEIPTEYFVRQKYCPETNTFTTFRKSDLVCNHAFYSDLEDVENNYKVGDTILAERTVGDAAILEPYIIQEFIYHEEAIKVRELLRRARDCKDLSARPNELVWTNYALKIAASTVERKCHIRFYRADERSQIPTPYDRDGQADCWYITSCIRPNSEELEDLEGRRPGPMNEGFDPTARISYPPLASLSLFSGGGNFDRGLEEAGALETRWAVEWNADALHTNRASCKSPETIGFYLGSVDDHLREAIAGRSSKLVPDIGEVSMLCGGSPCQGLSNMQRYTQSIESKRNTSKLASVASYVDHYRPAYAILENVMGMTRSLGKEENESVFSQMLCVFLAMGYQVQQFCLDAWSFGSPQKRSRLFISIAAPGLIPLQHPPLTHSHPPGLTSSSLGTAPNGEKICVRRTEATQFKFVSARESTRDLPNIGQGQVQTCIPFPDHRIGFTTSRIYRALIHAIPVKDAIYPLPKGIKLKTNLYAGYKLGNLSGPSLEYFKNQNETRKGPNSSSWSRIDGDGLFHTVTTCLGPTDAYTGYGVHWEQHRVLTLMEARRAQGILDHEPLIGDMAKQWKIVGNSVARQVSLALGMQVREAWLASSQDAVDRILKPVEGLELDRPPQPVRFVVEVVVPRVVHLALNPQPFSEDDTVPSPGANASDSTSINEIEAQTVETEFPVANGGGSYASFTPDTTPSAIIEPDELRAGAPSQSRTSTPAAVSADIDGSSEGEFYTVGSALGTHASRHVGLPVRNSMD